VSFYENKRFKQDSRIDIENQKYENM
jgi:hypothetical protein